MPAKFTLLAYWYKCANTVTPEYSVYLLYSYKSANTVTPEELRARHWYSVYLLYWYKSANTDA